jgi:hypothetical protein
MVCEIVLALLFGRPGEVVLARVWALLAILSTLPRLNQAHALGVPQLRGAGDCHKSLKIGKVRGTYDHDADDPPMCLRQSVDRRRPADTLCSQLYGVSRVIPANRGRAGYDGYRLG